jgi:hypothetical protein
MWIIGIVTRLESVIRRNFLFFNGAKHGITGKEDRAGRQAGIQHWGTRQSGNLNFYLILNHWQRDLTYCPLFCGTSKFLDINRSA